MYKSLQLSIDMIAFRSPPAVHGVVHVQYIQSTQNLGGTLAALGMGFGSLNRIDPLDSVSNYYVTRAL